jgi:two-component system sensor histidine kinase CreC
MACECPGDAFLITQAVMNLFQNALEFSPRGADIGVTLKRSGETVVVEIRDQGPGIPEFARNKIFDRFFSIQRPDTRKKSTGLGLNFVREIALLHGGSIDVKNNPDFGVRAVLRLPAA